MALLEILAKAGPDTQAQFVIATHSPLLLACPGAAIFSFDGEFIQKIAYEDTTHFKIYNQFLSDPAAFLESSPDKYEGA